MMREKTKRYLLTGVLLVATASTASAQFHSKSKTGQTQVNQQAVNSVQQQAAGTMSSAGKAQVGTNEHSTIYVSEAHRQNYGARMGRQDSKNVEVWGRAIHHTDGTYTESKQDNLTNTLEQITKSDNGVKLQRRMVMLDETGRPTEVMIYDGRDQFKYRGVQIYDQLGRFTEEQLYDAEGTLIRRKVQEYDPAGNKLPVRSWDYVANIPADLKLVITRENEDPSSSQERAPEPERRGLFGNPRTQAAPQQVQSAPAPAEATPAKRKGLNLGRLFSAKKGEK